MVNETSKQELSFVYLSSFAAWLLQHIDAYTNELVRLCYEVDLPLLKVISHLSEEEKFQFSKKLNIEFLTNLSQNNAAGHIEGITDRWLQGKFENIGRLDVDAKDVTLINYVRSKTQKKFIKQYTTDPELVYQLHTEIDDLAFAYNTKSINDYLQVLKDKIVQETHFSRNIIEASPGITFIYDLVEQREVYITGRVEEVTGFTPEEVLATKDLIAQFTHPDDISIVAGFLHAVVEDKEGKTQYADYRFRSKGGSYYWLRCYAVVYRRNSQGEPLQLLGTAYDITKEKETALTLYKREQQLLEAQAIGMIGSYEWNIQTDTSVTTPELRKIFEADQGYNFKEMLGSVHPGDVRKVKEALHEAFITGRYACEYRFLTQSGVKVIDAKGVVTFDGENKPLLLSGTVQDITIQKRIEASLRQKTLDLERSNEQLQQFASIASHDLKEPLRKISMFSDIIMTADWDSLSERTKANLQKIAHEATRMQKLIEGVLSYSSTNPQMQMERVNLEELLQEAISNLDYKIKETGAVITSDGLPNADVIPLQIQQLFQNLIANAMKFSKKQVVPAVQVTHSIRSDDSLQNKNLRPSKQYLQIEVSDNGIGFDDTDAQKIFGLFQRLHGRNDYEGSGIGLAICKRIVENHGGAISASSEAGAGTTFTIILPLINSESQ